MNESEKKAALDSIALIRNLVEESRREMSHAGSGWICIIWGLYTFVGYAGSHLLHRAGAFLLSGLWWPFLMLFGLAASLMVIRRNATSQSSKVRRQLVGSFVLFWIPLVLLMASLVTLCGLLPDLPTKYAPSFILLVVSTGYLMIGFLLHKSLLAMAILGFAGTMVTTIFFIEQAGWILTLLFGFGLIATGLLLNRKR